MLSFISIILYVNVLKTNSKQAGCFLYVAKIDNKTFANGMFDWILLYQVPNVNKAINPIVIYSSIHYLISSTFYQLITNFLKSFDLYKAFVSKTKNV